MDLEIQKSLLKNHTYGEAKDKIKHLWHSGLITAIELELLYIWLKLTFTMGRRLNAAETEAYSLRFAAFFREFAFD